jgi:dipeptidyl aminopeptidase/acylaminoacyl peptidase
MGLRFLCTRLAKVAFWALNSTRTAIGFSAQASDPPPEAFALPANGGKAKQVSHVDTGSPTLTLGRTESVHWEGPGNLDIEGLSTYPVDYQNCKRYPLIAISRGGPPSNFSQAFIAGVGHYPIAAFADRGYAVLRSNVCGSTGCGKQFRYASYGDWVAAIFGT